MGCILQLAPQVFVAEHPNGAELVDSNSGSWLHCNKVSAQILAGISEGRDVDGIADLVSEKFQVERTVAKRDVGKFLEELQRGGFLAPKTSTDPRGFTLTARALWELILYDLTNARAGFGGVCDLAFRRPKSRHRHFDSPQPILDSVNLAACFYPKTILCMQRSVVTARLLSRYGFDCHLVIGYRPLPFFSHAWVEMEGRGVVDDSPGYAKQLRVLKKL